MIESVHIEPVEDGWHLVLDGDLSRECAEYAHAREGVLDVRLSSEAAAQLVRQVEPIREHLAEGDAVRREFEASGRISWDEHVARGGK